MKNTISAHPEPGEYEEPLYVRLKSSHKILYSLESPLPLGTWTELSSVPLPVRTGAGLLETDRGILLVGGKADQNELFLCDKFKDNSWICNKDFPIPLDKPGILGNRILGGYSNGKPSKIHVLWQDKKWKSLCPPPIPLASHAFAELDEKIYVFCHDILIYDKRTDRWDMLGKKHNSETNSAAVVYNKNIFLLTSTYGILKFDPINSELSSYFSAAMFGPGMNIFCHHDEHFIVADNSGLHRVNLENRTIQQLDSFSHPIINASNHIIMAENKLYKYSCPFFAQSYEEGIFLASKGNYKIFTLSLEKNNLVSNSFEYTIRDEPLVLTFILSKDITTFVWSSFEKNDGSPVRISDITPQNSVLSLSVSDETTKCYTQELLSAHPYLNKPLEPGKTYRVSIVKSKNQKERIKLEGRRGNLQNIKTHREQD